MSQPGGTGGQPPGGPGGPNQGGGPPHGGGGQGQQPGGGPLPPDAAPGSPAPAGQQPPAPQQPPGGQQPPPGGGGWTAPQTPGGGPPGDPYGPGAFEQIAQSGYQPDAEEAEHAFYAHLAGAVGAFLFCGVIVPVAAPLIVLAIAKEKKPFMLYHLNQSVIFQAALFVVNAGIATIATILTFFCIGALLWVIYPITWGVAVVYPLVVAFAARRGEWTGYAVIGDKLRREWKPLFK